MNIQHVFQELQSASDFELFRLKAAINKLLEDPDRVNALRKKMIPGMQLDFFCEERNRSIACLLLEIKRSRDNQEYIGKVSKLPPKRAVILIGNTAWTVPYRMLFPIINTELDDNCTLLLAE